VTLGIGVMSKVAVTSKRRAPVRLIDHGTQVQHNYEQGDERLKRVARRDFEVLYTAIFVALALIY
jgi:hypothetical protein